jgi:hypothetical protein
MSHKIKSGLQVQKLLLISKEDFNVGSALTDEILGGIRLKVRESQCT